MLQQMRQMKMFVFWFVAVVFLVGFVFLGGLNVGKLQGHDENVVLKVNGQPVQTDAYNRYVSLYVDAERRRSGRDVLSTADYDRVEDEAWNEMITDLLLRQEAERLGIHAQDAEIVETLSRSPPPWVQQRFRNEQGQFDAAAFQAAVNDPSYDWGPDERAVRLELPKAKLQQLVRARAAVGEQEVRDEYARRHLTTKLRYVGVSLRDIDLKGWTPSDEQVHAYYEQHPELFTHGETVTLEIIRVPKKASPGDEADAIDDAREVLDEEKKGETFAALAEVYSDDPSSTHGGEQGWVRAESVDPQLRDALAALQPGQTSSAIRTDHGFYILHADSVRTTGGAHETKLREILLVPKISGETLDSLRTRAVTAAEKAHKDFEGAARDLGVPVQRLESVEQFGILPTIGYSKRLVDWAFAASPGEVSKPVGTEDAVLLARLVEKKPAGPQPFEAIQDQVRAATLDNELKTRARQRIDAFLERVRGGAAFDAAARAEGLAVKEPAPFGFYDAVPDVGAATEFSAVALALEPGKASGAVETSSGTYALQVISRDAFDANAYQSERSSIYESLLTMRQAEAYQAWLEDLRERATIDDRRRPRV